MTVKKTLSRPSPISACLPLTEPCTPILGVRAPPFTDHYCHRMFGDWRAVSQRSNGQNETECVPTVFHRPKRSRFGIAAMSACLPLPESCMPQSLN